MGKRRVEIIRVPKGVTWFLLLVTTAAMTLLLDLLSGRAYAAEPRPAREILARLLAASTRGTVAPDALLAFLMPIAADILFFMPWGFLAFLALDTKTRPRSVTYAMTLVAAALFASVMYAWQSFLPTRVTGLSDLLSNGLGALAGAAVGHARKRVRIHFEF